MQTGRKTKSTLTFEVIMKTVPELPIGAGVEVKIKIYKLRETWKNLFGKASFQQRSTGSFLLVH